MPLFLFSSSFFPLFLPSFHYCYVLMSSYLCCFQASSPTHFFHHHCFLYPHHFSSPYHAFYCRCSPLLVSSFSSSNCSQLLLAFRTVIYDSNQLLPSGLSNLKAEIMMPTCQKILHFCLYTLQNFLVVFAFILFQFCKLSLQTLVFAQNT